MDYTSEEKRKEIVKACIECIIDHPSCLGNYQSTNVLKPNLAELVDKGTVKDEDGVIKKFYNGMVTRAGGSVDPELALNQDIKDVLATAFKKYKEDVAIHPDMSFPMTKEKACENPRLASTAGFDMNSGGASTYSEMCIVFLSWHPNCLEKHETTKFIETHLEDLIQSGKINGYAPGSSEPGSSTENVGVALRRGIVDAMEAKGSQGNSYSQTCRIFRAIASARSVARRADS